MILNNHYLELLKRTVINYLYLGANESFDEHNFKHFSAVDQKWTIPELAQPHSC